ncbi:hypothetical protein BKA65DRAFT_221642 [Rhexocercosporidium sp. MPI-PUGE-AT-0058]|nr:hypothetical protein BKA65DRAFT_221642 [Rhexocercosporidium sp. MPI-PUGE-AT-0058]
MQSCPTAGAPTKSLQEMQASSSSPTPSPSLISKLGCQKILKCSEIAASFGFEYIWIDTCCIDKTNNVELTEAINSMFNYYRDAEVCYAYLADVQSEENPGAEGSGFRRSSWFKRGWTLQELIAGTHCTREPGVLWVNWRDIGTKSSLEAVVAEITLISPTAIKNYEIYGEIFSISQKMAWASYRETERLEDLAYCLMGLLNVNMPLIYGEGDKAFKRLQLEILKESNDQSIFAWRAQSSKDTQLGRGLLAYHPAEFRDAHNIVNSLDRQSEFSMTNLGLKITLPFLNREMTESSNERRSPSKYIFIAVLGCYKGSKTHCYNVDSCGIYLQSVAGVYTRIYTDKIELVSEKLLQSSASNRTVCVPQTNAPRSVPSEPDSHCIHVFQRRPSPVSDIHTSNSANHNLVPWKLGNDEVKLKLGSQSLIFEEMYALLFLYGKPKAKCVIHVFVTNQELSYCISTSTWVGHLNKLRRGFFPDWCREKMTTCDRSSFVLRGGQVLHIAIRQGFVDGIRALYFEVSADGDFHLEKIFRQLLPS